MNMNIKNINEEILENVSGGRPIGRDGKPISPSEYKNRTGNDGIHVTSATFGPAGTQPVFTSTYEDGIHVTSATFGPEIRSTDYDGIHVTSATF